MWFLIFLILNIFRIINLEEIEKFWFLKLKILLMLGIYLVRMFCERFSSKFLKGDRKIKIIIWKLVLSDFDIWLEIDYYFCF